MAKLKTPKPVVIPPPPPPKEPKRPAAIEKLIRGQHNPGSER